LRKKNISKFINYYINEKKMLTPITPRAMSPLLEPPPVVKINRTPLGEINFNSSSVAKKLVYTDM
jgi:hypothetical protein